MSTSQLSLGYSRITAPVAGRISRAQVTPGNLVSVGSPVLSTIVASDTVEVWFDASESSFLKVSQALRAGGAAPTVAVGLANEVGFPHSGVVDFVDNRLNPATGSIRVRATLDNKDGQRVAKGALLFTIDPKPFAAEVERAQAQLASTRTQSALATMVDSTGSLTPTKLPAVTAAREMRPATGAVMRA